MRRQLSRARPGRAVALVCALSLVGCKKQESAAESNAPDAGKTAQSAPAVPDAGAALVADTRTPFLFKDVKISRTGADVKLEYTLVNQGAKRARGLSCVSLHDKDGYQFLDLALGPISLRGGESDAFEDSKAVAAELWAQARTVRLYAAPSCYSSTADSVISQVSHLDPTGRPAPKDAPAARPMANLEDGVVVFDVKDVGLSQEDPSSSVSVTYTVTNNSSSRANASLCVRLYDAESSAGDIDEASTTYFNLAAGASETLTAELTPDDEAHWDSTVYLKAYVSNYGCASSARVALSNVVELRKPAEIRSPRDDVGHSDEDHAGGDGYVPDEPVDDPVAVDDPVVE